LCREKQGTNWFIATILVAGHPIARTLLWPAERLARATASVSAMGAPVTVAIVATGFLTALRDKAD
jgi:hypothetical protein